MEQKFTINELYQGHTMSEVNDVLSLSENIIDNLDEYALAELCGGYSWDVDKLFLDIINESNYIINSGEGVQSFSFNYLESLTNSLDNYLKDLSLAYFVSNTITDFNIEPYHLEWFNMIQLYRFLCVLAARGHSKSFAFSYAYLLWCAWKYKGKGKIGKETTLITAEESLATVFIDLIKTQIEQNPILKEKLYPSSSEGIWARNTIKTKNGWQLVGKGLNSSLRGLHTDIICDDILDESNFYNDNVRKETIELFNNVIMNIPLPKTGKVTVVGTPFHNEDLYTYLKKAKGWRVFEYPGIYPDGTLLSPERFSLQELLDKKQTIGNLAFSREILMKPITNATSLFPMRVMKMNLVDTVRMTPNRYNFPVKIIKLGFGIDLAAKANADGGGEGEDPDYFVCAIVAMDELKRYWLLNYYRERGLSYNQQLQVVKRLNDAFNPDIIMVESNQYQKMFADLLRNNGLTNVVERATTNNKYDFQIGLPALSVLFEQFRFKIPYENDIYTRNLADMAMAEFNSMTFNDNKLQSAAGHDDICMATWLAVTGLNYVNNELIVSFLNV